MLARLILVTLAMVGSALVALTVASASGPVDIYNGGDLHESIGQGDTKPLSRGVAYTASTFPLAVRVRPPDTLWEGVQLHSGKYRFVQLHHLRAGSMLLHGVGYITLEASAGRTGSVAATVKNLHSTPLLKSGPIKPVRVAGLAGKRFDATVVGRDIGSVGISLTPFTVPYHCGFCEVVLNGETQDNKFAGEGQLFRIIVAGVRGKTVVIYVESSLGDSTTRNNPPTVTFPTFLPFAQKMLSALRFPR